MAFHGTIKVGDESTVEWRAERTHDEHPNPGWFWYECGVVAGVDRADPAQHWTGVVAHRHADGPVVLAHAVLSAFLTDIIDGPSDTTPAAVAAP